MHDTQITKENTTIWFSFSLTRLDLYWLKAFFVEGTWKCTATHIENNIKLQTITACNYLNLISFQLTFQHFRIFSTSGVFFILLKLTFIKLRSCSPTFLSFWSTFFQIVFPANQLTSTVNGSIHPIINPRSCAISMELISSCIKQTLCSILYILNLLHASFPSLDLLLHLIFLNIKLIIPLTD